MRLDLTQTRWRVLAAVLALLLVVGGLGGWQAWTLKGHADALQSALARDLSAAAAELTAGKQAVSAANGSNDPAKLQEANAHLDKARTHFKHAKQLIDSDPLLAQASTIPLPQLRRYIAPRKAAVDDLAGMGLALCDAGQDGVAVDAQLIKPGGSAQTAGEKLIATLHAAQPLIGKITADLQRAKTFAGRVDVTVLPSSQRASFIKARDQIQTGLDGLSQFNELAPVLLDLMGANGPRTYLVLNTGPAELRGGGGFIGSYILVTADKGAIKLGESKNVYDLDYPYPVKGQKRFIPPPSSLNEFATHGWVFGDANFYSDFPTSARAAERLFQNETGKTVDGVVAIDPYAAAAMLELTGPLKIPEYSTTVNAATFPDDLVHRLLTDANNVPGKKTFFPVVANHLLGQLTSLGSDKWPALIDKLNTSVGQRHLQVYMNRDNVQSVLGKLGWSGATAPPEGKEFMQEVESNYGGNKANYWLTRSFNLDLALDGTQLKHSLNVKLKNATPPGYEGGQLYRVYFRMYCPANATEVSSSGLLPDKYPSDEKPAGLQLMDGWYQVGANATYDQARFAWTTGVADIATGHAIYWQKQPGTLTDKVHITYHVNGHTYTADTDLTQDRVIVLTAEGVKVQPGTSGSIKIPSIG